MQRSVSTRSIMNSLCLIALGAIPARALDPERKVTDASARAPNTARQAAERGLAFLLNDAAKWRKERHCATCHHGTMTVWVLSEAKRHGFAVDDEIVMGMTEWAMERLENIDKPRDTRPGWKMVSTPAVFLAVMAVADSNQNLISSVDLRRIAGHLMRHQETDGSWAWSSAPAQNRPPPVFESDEVVTLLADLALGQGAEADTIEKNPVRESRARAAAWLEKQKPGASTQSRALQLYRDVCARKPLKELETGVKRLLTLQHADGGWAQEQALRSDGFATGQALYFLGLTGVEKDRTEIQRAVAFLVRTQKKDGSWPMTSRAHSGAKPMTNPVPITYFGSAWATMGLMRSLPK
jgi:squalene cyclase